MAHLTLTLPLLQLQCLVWMGQTRPLSVFQSPRHHFSSHQRAAVYTLRICFLCLQ